jgi:membrane fusion protein, heavy metal efflux system
MSRTTRFLMQVLLACLGHGYACAATTELKLSAAQITALGIESASVNAGEPARLSGLPGLVVVPNAQLRVLSAPVAGLIEQILVTPQQNVRKGQLLARLQSPALGESQKGFLQARTQLDLAKTQMDRDERLFKEGIISESRVQGTRSRWTEASVALTERSQALRLAGLSEPAIRALQKDGKMTTTVDLLSPIDGVLLEQIAMVGQRVEAASALLKLGQLNPLWLEIQVPASQLALIREGALVTALVPISGRDVQAKVTLVARQMNAGNQSATVRAVTLRGADVLLPGQALEVSIQTGGVAGQWAIPNQALLRSAGRTSLFVKTVDGFQMQDVKVLSEGQDNSVVTGPLNTNSRIVVKGAVALKAIVSGIGSP